LSRNSAGVNCASLFLVIVVKVNRQPQHLLHSKDIAMPRLRFAALSTLLVLSSVFCQLGGALSPAPTAEAPTPVPPSASVVAASPGATPLPPTPVPPTVTSIPPSNTPRPTRTPSPTPPPPEHHIGIRSVNGVAEFFDRRTGLVFVPRGANYLHFAPQIMPWGENRYQDATFATDRYNPDEVDAALRQMQSLGYNVVRVFLIDSNTGMVGHSTSLSPGYVANVADFLTRAARYDIFVWFTIDWLPGGRYGEMSNRECCTKFGSTNLQLMTAGAVEATGLLFADL
jgi:hypothetical protein